MKQLISLLLLMCLFANCSEKKATVITVANPSSIERTGEIAEMDAAQVTGQFPDGNFIITDFTGKEVPYQITHDKKLIFPVTLKGHETANFTLKAGTPQVYNTVAYGKLYPERLDDIAWENDKIAFRTYGPALQATGERAFGYDIWVKSVPELVVENRYKQELENGISYHEDHGNGLDFYSVGPTLGAGTSALMVDSALVYPYCYKTYEILDNGPLRFTVKLTYNPLTVGKDANVIETRILSLDAGSQLNKITVSYANLSQPTPIATGIVMHAPSEEYQANPEKGFIAYAVNNDPVNGQIYVGAAFPSNIQEAKVVYFPEQEKQDRKANGHLLAISEYTPGTPYTYYAGGGWSKGGFTSPVNWYNYMNNFAQKLREPVKVTVND